MRYMLLYIFSPRRGLSFHPRDQVLPCSQVFILMAFCLPILSLLVLAPYVRIVSRVPSQRFTGLQASDMYSYLCLCVCVGKCHVCVGVPRMAEEGVGCSGTVVTGSYKLPDVGTEN